MPPNRFPPPLASWPERQACVLNRRRRPPPRHMSFGASVPRGGVSDRNQRSPEEEQTIFRNAISDRDADGSRKREAKRAFDVLKS